MDHREIEDKLSAYLDGELSDVERGGVAAHLTSCVSCRDALRRLETFGRAVASALRTSDDESFVARVMGSIDEPKAEPVFVPTARGFVWPFRVPEWMLPGIGLGVAAVLFLFLVPPQQAIGVSTEDVLLSGVTDPSKWLFESDHIEEAPYLDFRWEES